MLPIVALACLTVATPVPKPFLIGVDFQESASQKVKDLFWETGCNFARVTGGGYGWAVDAHKRAMKELDDHGVRVLLQLGSHYPSADYFELKDSYFIDHNGKSGEPDRNAWAVTYSGQAWPQYTYASDRFKQGLEKDFTAYLKAVSPLKNVEALLLHNEPGYFWVDERVFDFNPYAISRFRSWLPAQHKTIEILNRRWGTSFASFNEVEPPHETPPVKNVAAWLDWRRFNADLIRDFLAWEGKFSKKVQPTLPTTTNLSGALDNWFALRLGDNYRFTETLDIASIDIYPGQWTSRYYPGYAMDMTLGAAAGKRVFVAECEVYDATNFGKLSDVERATRLGSDLWTYIGHGAKGILMWSLSGQGGFHLTDGEFNPRLAVVRETAHFAKMLRLGEFTKPKRQVALVVDQDAFIYYGGTTKNREGAVTVDSASQGLYAAMVKAGYEVDVISAGQVRKGVGKAYKALVLATPALMDTELAQKLTQFVSGGGVLVSGKPLASLDRWGAVLSVQPGFGLDRLLGSKGGRAVIVNSDSEVPVLLKGIRPESAVSSNGFVDTCTLVDPKGNRLLVMTNPSEKAAAPEVRSNVRFAKDATGYLFQPSSVAYGRVRTGPRRIEKGFIPVLRGYAAVLTTKEHAPLISTDSPVAAASGAQVQIVVSVYNPSRAKLNGTLSLRAPKDWMVRSIPVAVPANGDRSFTFNVRAGAANERAVLKAVLESNKAGTPIESVPIDMRVGP